MTIDTHAHALDEAFLLELCRMPRFGLAADRDACGRFCVRRGDAAPASLDDDLSDIPRRVQSLRRRNVGLQLVSPPPGFASWPGGAADVEYARKLNEHGARVVAQGEGLLELMVTLPLGEPENCAYELERALDLYGARSALLPATAGGRPLETGAFDRMFSMAEKRRILMFLHPVSAEPPSRVPVHTLQLVVQWPAETVLAVARMIFAGFFERFPRLNLLLAHGGGGLLFLKGRLNSAYEARGAEGHPYFTDKITRPPGDYFRQFYFDTCSQSPESVEFTIRVAGYDRVMFGTDYPFEVGDADGMRALPALDNLPARVRQQILHDNAASILNAVHRRPSAPVAREKG
jgi:aminocarboxymuconate-semialdehyde decarboxylase